MCLSWCCFHTPFPRVINMFKGNSLDIWNHLHPEGFSTSIGWLTLNLEILYLGNTMLSPKLSNTVAGELPKQAGVYSKHTLGLTMFLNCNIDLTSMKSKAFQVGRRTMWLLLATLLLEDNRPKSSSLNLHAQTGRRSPDSLTNLLALWGEHQIILPAEAE